MVRRKLGLGSNSRVGLAQLRNGTVIDLEDGEQLEFLCNRDCVERSYIEDDFAALRVLSMSTSAVDVRVTVADTVSFW